jgi:hypothetical protein
MINWENLYNKLIKEKVSLEGEKHHIVPKHDGGKDEDGIVVLERKYHILAHYIRWRWKKQIGDKVAYQIMRGQLLNPMLDSEMKKHVMEIINSMTNDPKYIEYRKNKQIELWKNYEYREKTSKARKVWIEKENNRHILANRLNTETAKKKRIAQIKKYYVNADPLLISKRNSKKVCILENSKVLDSVTIAAEYFKVCTATICRWAKQGNKIKYIK